MVISEHYTYIHKYQTHNAHLHYLKKISIDDHIYERLYINIYAYTNNPTTIY